MDDSTKKSPNTGETTENNPVDVSQVIGAVMVQTSMVLFPILLSWVLRKFTKKLMPTVLGEVNARNDATLSVVKESLDEAKSRPQEV